MASKIVPFFFLRNISFANLKWGGSQGRILERKWKIYVNTIFCSQEIKAISQTIFVVLKHSFIGSCRKNCHDQPPNVRLACGKANLNANHKILRMAFFLPTAPTYLLWQFICLPHNTPFRSKQSIHISLSHSSEF